MAPWWRWMRWWNLDPEDQGMWMATVKKVPRAAQPAAVAQERDDEEAEAGGRERHFINGLAKGLAVIQAFNDEARALTLAEAAARTGLTRAAARRILMTLQD